MESLDSLSRMHWDREPFLRKSGIGLPHSTTLARVTARHSFREVVECGSPMPLSRLYGGIRNPDPQFMESSNIRAMCIVTMNPHPQSCDASGLPLPQGEGWGEGEGIIRQPIVYERSHRIRQHTAHGEPPFPSHMHWNLEPPCSWRRGEAV